MSGIAVVFNLDGRPVDLQALSRMMDTLQHRGPDDSGLWLDRSIGLGHRMLWTTPESLHEKLPIAHPAQVYVLTADARIDNRADLMAELAINAAPSEVSDSQLILVAYERWGIRCPEHLLGDFAFVIWDSNQQQLFCARDHFGIKPLYYYCRPGTAFLCASEMKALFCLPDVPHQVNELRIADYLYPMLEDPAITAYQDIWRLPPGHTLVIKPGGEPYIRRYWALDIGEELKLESNQAYAEAFREIFTEAVHCRLRSAFPVGSHLSGGLDSSSVTCVARELLSQGSRAQLHTFSNVFNQVTECDERAFIEPVLNQGGVIPHFAYPDQIGPLSEWKQLFSPFEEPCLIGGNGFLVRELNRVTQQAGVRVVLDGFDGDTTVSHGFGYFAELAQQGQWDKFAAEAKAVAPHFQASPGGILRKYGFAYLQELAKQGRWLAFGRTVTAIHQHFQVSRRRLWWHLGLKTVLPPLLLRAWRGQPRKAAPELPELINAEFARRVGMGDRAHTLERPDYPLLGVSEEQWFAFTSGKFTLALEQADLAAAAFSIETRHPFMDKRLIEFCLSLPSSQKLDQGWSRMVLRRAMQGYLPEPVQWRGGKTDMTPNFIHGLMTHDQNFFYESIFKAKNGINNYINLDALERSRAALVFNKKIDDNHITIAWVAIGLGLWLYQVRETYRH